MMIDIKEVLIDAGCDETLNTQIATLYENGRLADAGKLLRLHRSRLLTHLHACNEKLYTLDCLIRKFDKERKEENGRKTDTDR